MCLSQHTQCAFGCIQNEKENMHESNYPRLQGMLRRGATKRKSDLRRLNLLHFSRKGARHPPMILRNRYGNKLLFYRSCCIMPDEAGSHIEQFGPAAVRTAASFCSGLGVMLDCRDCHPCHVTGFIEVAGCMVRSNAKHARKR